VEISILLPTRGRPKWVQRFLDSIVETAKKPESIETILFIDDDDVQSHLIDHPYAKVMKLIQPRRTLGEMYRCCFEISQGKIVMLSGDDFVFRTSGWDGVVKGLFRRFSDKILLVYGNDLNQGPRVCTAPFISRRMCEILGAPCPPEYTGEFIDAHIFDTFQKIKASGYDRIRYIDDIIIEHMHHVVGKAPFDETYANRTPTAWSRELYDRLDGVRKEQAKMLLKHLQG
jgi:glycosyltransferase involved in cell wall biosynthesis